MKLLYIILLIAAAVFYPLFKDDLSFILLITLLVIPVFLAVLLLFTSRKLKITVTDDEQRAVRDESFLIFVKITNPLPLPVSACYVKVRYRMSGEKKWCSYSAGIPMRAFSSETVEIALKPAHCGTVEYVVKNAEICDLIGLFSRKIKLDINGKTAVFPKELPCCASLEEIPAQKDEYGALSAGKGNDPSEITGFREYTDGDRMNRIHWKLSSRSENLIVKELADSYSGKILLIPDASACSDTKDYDSVMDVFFSLSSFMVRNAESFSVLSSDGELKIKAVKNSDELELQLTELLENTAENKGEISLTAAFSEECMTFSAERYSHIIIITPHEKQAVLSELEHSCCAERISVLCTGAKGSVDESSSSDVLVYYLKRDGQTEIPNNFII
ncbi:MAG: DUF58 domain-containing protein [Oscillospiraceae bacterium]|nr:DUF58 domain-containing protein [Oscillospiraceae bacterium]